LHSGEWRDEVDLEDSPVEVQVGLSDSGVGSLTGVVDEDVDPTVFVEGASDEALEVGWVGDIGGDGKWAAVGAGGTKLTRDGSDPFLPASDKDEMGACRVGNPGRRCPDAAAGSRNDDDCAVDLHHIPFIEGRCDGRLP
jgi:hypothetical protein